MKVYWRDQDFEAERVTGRKENKDDQRKVVSVEYSFGGDEKHNILATPEEAETIDAALASINSPLVKKASKGKDKEETK
jgi:hypothetical protein